MLLQGEKGYGKVMRILLKAMELYCRFPKQRGRKPRNNKPVQQSKKQKNKRVESSDPEFRLTDSRPRRSTRRKTKTKTKTKTVDQKMDGMQRCGFRTRTSSLCFGQMLLEILLSK